MKRLPEAELGAQARAVSRAGRTRRSARGPAPGPVAVLLRDRVATLTEMADAAHYFYAAPHPSAGELAEHVGAGNRGALTELAAEFASVDWSREALGAAMKSAAARHGLKPPQVMMAMRALVCGTPSTPAIDAVLALLGRDEVVSRLAAGLGSRLSRDCAAAPGRPATPPSRASDAHLVRGRRSR